MAKTRKAKENLHKLEQAQRKLIAEVNKLIQEAKKESYTTKVSPQVLRLAGLREYRTRDLAKISSLLDSPELLQQNVAVIDNSTGEIVRGEEAFERYARYESSGIYHASKTPLSSTYLFGEEVPSEAERTINNFVEIADDVIHDDSAYKEFEAIVMKAIEQDTTIADFNRWCIEHPFMADPRKSHKEILRSMVYWLYINRDNSMEMQSSLYRLESAEGYNEVARRIQSAGESLLDSAITAAIGYQENSGRAIQDVLKVLLPTATRERAMAIQDLTDIADGFEDFD